MSPVALFHYLYSGYGVICNFLNDYLVLPYLVMIFVKLCQAILGDVRYLSIRPYLVVI